MTGRGLRGRRLARLVLIAAIALDVALAYLFLVVWNHPGPMFREPPSFWVGLIPVAIGVGLHVIGLIWMMRIYRADPEGRRSWWRFHRS